MIDKEGLRARVCVCFCKIMVCKKKKKALQCLNKNKVCRIGLTGLGCPRSLRTVVGLPLTTVGLARSYDTTGVKNALSHRHHAVSAVIILVHPYDV